MRTRLLLIGLIGLPLGFGCASKPDANIATGDSNAGVNEAAFPVTIGPEPKGAPAKSLPTQRKLTEAEQIAAVKASKMPPHIKEKMLGVIRRTHGRGASATPPASGVAR